LTAEHESLKQRTRHFPQRNPDPNAEVNILRKENDRMRRENKNLQQTLTTQSDQIEDLEKKLKRRTEHMRVSILI
jgi:predicted RNase H-like nuclease (RuvC/YqgF family)